jgi:dihydroxyacetone kinase-like protein
MDVLDRACILGILDAICLMTRENQEYLTDLDAAIGDADHGINLARGFEAVRDQLEQMASLDIGAVLKSVGMTLVSEVGGASGPLYGTAFIEAGKTVQGKTEINRDDLIALGEAALSGIKRRGRSERGEKTMIDAIEPALDAFRSAGSLLDGLRAANEAAHTGVQETIGMIAKKGRASYLGPRSVGHQDPGATSSALMIEVVYRRLKEGGP